MSEHDPVNNPQHYKTLIPEPISVIENWGLGFCLGNAVKYISRAGKKDNIIIDLKKAAWYLDREIKNLEYGLDADIEKPAPATEKPTPVPVFGKDELLHAYSKQIKKLADALDYAWTIICNAGGGDWDLESEDWRKAAAKLRTDYFALLGNGKFIKELEEMNEPSALKKVMDTLSPALKETKPIWPKGGPVGPPS